MKLIVKSLREAGFCRLGVKWPAEGKVVESSEYTDEEWERLMKEPNLKVERVAEDHAEEDGSVDTSASLGEDTGNAGQDETADKPAQTTKGNGSHKAANAGA